MSRSWLSHIRRLFFPWHLPIRRSPANAKRRRPWLMLEALEGRWVPSNITVMSNQDNGSGTLRAALMAASGATTIDFAANVRSITLTSAGLTIPNGVSIVNDLGVGSVTISGNNGTTVFTVNGSTTATLSGLTITDGFSSGGGGGIANLGTLTVSASTLSGNSAVESGGGIFNGGTLTVSASTLSGNSARVDGGGIFNNGGTLTVSASTLSGNSASAGGGIYNFGTLMVSASTLSGNSTHFGGGGIFNAAGTATLNSDIVAGNSGGDLGGNVSSSSSFNLIGTGGSDGLSDSNGNQVNVPVASINLAPLGYYGGPTETLALLPGSLAIGHGSVGVTTDQRGFTTPGDTSISVGAFQFGPLVVNTTDDTPGADSPGLLTLRQAINLADADTTTMAQPITFDSHMFASSQTITLTNGTLTLGGSGTIAPITITGPIAGVTISGDDSYIVFTVNGSTTATLSGLTITDGFTTGGGGGGIYNQGTLTVSASTLSGNSAINGTGGGIANGGTLTVSASTLSGNSAINGGGIYNFGTLTVSASTLSGNSASVQGGGIENENVATLNSDIVAGNSGGDLGGSLNVALSSSFNVIGTGGSNGLTNSNGNQVNVPVASINLAPLGYYGGPTETLALLPGSVAIHAGEMVAGLTTDQRGLPLDSPPDVGAFQSGSLVVNTTADSDSPGLLTLRDALAIADADTTTMAQPITFDSHVFASSQTITLTNGTLTLGTGGTIAPLTITGPSAGVTISGDDSFRVFIVDSSTTATLSGLTITDGNAEGGAIGGGIYNDGTLTVSGSTLSANSAVFSGSGIFNNGGTLTVSASTLSGNSTDFSGGGIFNNDGTLTVSASTLSGNSGGGIYNNAGTATLNSDIVAGNSGGDLDGINVASSSSFNLIGTGGSDGLTNTNGNQVDIPIASINLASLGYYGGPTETLALLPGSVAIGHGETVPGVTTDQRGLPLDSPQPDVGAFQSGPLVVNTTADSDSPGLLTLRDALAIADADTTTMALPITFSPTVFASSQTITLTNSTLTLGGSGTIAPITITGPSAGVTISGNNKFTVFTVNGSTTATLSGLTITDGFTTGFGGGIANLGTLTVSASTFSGNSADGGGGGIENFFGTLTVSGSTLSGNSALGGGADGGGIYNSGTLIVSGSTLSGNSADYGGGIENIGGSCTVSGSTLSGNSAGTYYGGGIDNGVTLTVSGSTLSGNSAPRGGGGINNYGGGAATLTNTIVANSPSGGDLFVETSFGGGSYTGSYDLISDGSQSSSFTNSLFVNPRLAPLGNYGGPTQMLALLPGSPAIQTGETLTGVTSDQRGFALDSPPDIGAFQFQSSLVVNTTDDTPGADSPGLLTLRQAIAIADADTTTTAQPITFSPTVFASSQTITLTNGTLTLGGSGTIAPITITGPSAGVTISGNNSTTVFTVDSSTTATLSGLTIADGNAGNGFGGGIDNAGNCTVSGSTLSDDSANGAGGGGGIYNNGTLTVSGSTFSGNSANGGSNDGGGGGINNAGTLTVSGSTFSGNSANGYGSGGGIENNAGTLTVSGSTFSGNSAVYGGGIENYGGGSCTVSSSTLSGNSAVYGGGIINNGTLTVSGSTLSGNSASDGGGIDTYGGDITTLNGTIVANSTAGGDLTVDSNNGGGSYAGSYDLIGDGSESSSFTHVLTGNPLLAALGNYGGPTQTLALLPGSPAIQTGETLAGVTSDQRGFALDSPPDIGAFQFQSSLVVNTTDDTPGADSPGLLTLRQALALADADTTATPLPITFDPKVFASSQTITLTSGTLTLGGSGTIAPITITGPSAGVTIDGNGSFTVFTVNGSTTATLSGLTITDGKGSGFDSGGIDNFGTLTVGNSTLTDNIGGGIFNSGTLTVSASTFTDNSAPSEGGGGIINAGTLTVSGSTLSGNSAKYGGGIENFGTLIVSGSTLSGNSAGGGLGGGIDNSGTLTVSGSTLSGNSAPRGGGGINIYDGGAATLTNTIVANSSSGGDLFVETNAGGGSYTGSYDLIGDGSESSSFTHVLTGNPLLAPLGNYGGPTETLALLPGSVAIGSGSIGTAATPPDQRGFARPNGSAIDIGAFQSSPLVVNTTADSDGPGLLTLRDAVAIADADTTTTALPITFDPTVFATPRTITLTNGTLTLGGSGTIAPITITGPSAGVTISGANSFTVFTVDGNTTATLSGLTITDGFNSAASGGGIYNGGTLTVSASTLSGNSAFDGGGGILNLGMLTVSASTLSGNSAVFGDGGGIYNNGGTVMVSASTLSGNSAVFGGGIYNNGGTVMVSASTLSGNSAAAGGGIDNGGTLTVSGSTFSDDSASSNGDFGGGIYNQGSCTVSGSTFSNDFATDGGGINNAAGATLTLNGSTLSGNSATVGGGIRNRGTLTVSGSTLGSNSAGMGGGIADVGGASATLTNTIVANSLAGGDLYLDTGNSSSFAGSYDLIGDGSESSSFSHVLTGNPLLAPLGNYGGPTQTIALLPGSVAIGSGSIGVTTDQRGFTSVDNPIDIGAFQDQIVATAASVPTQIAGSSTSITLANFTDADPSAPTSSYTAVINWGDGSGNTTVTTTATAAGQLVALGGDSFTVVGAHTYAGFGTDTVAVTITDADANAKSVTLTAQVQNPTATMVLSTSNPSFFGQSVTFTATVTAGVGTFDNNGTVQFAVDGTNYGPSLNLSNGSTTIGDAALASGKHTITATYSGDTDFASSSANFSGGQFVLPTVQFKMGSESVNVNAGTFSVAVLLSAASDTTTTIPFTVGGTAVAGTDYSDLRESPLVVAAGSTSATISGLLLTGKPFGAPDPTLTLTLGTPTNATLSSITSNTLTIVESTPPPTVGFSTSGEFINENAGSFSITVTLSAASDTTTTIPFTLGGTAVSGTDYSGVTASPLVIAAGSTSATITGTLLENSLFAAPNKTLTVTLGTPTNATLGTPKNNTLTIVNDTPRPAVQFSVASESVNESAGTFSVTVTMSAASDTTTTIPFTLSGTGVSGTDYSGVTASPLVIPAGSTSATITGMLLQNDVFAAPNKTLTLTLGTPSNATLGDTPSNTLTIINDTPPPTVQFSAASESVNENAGTFTVTVTLSATSYTTTILPFSLGGTAVSGTDYNGVTASPLVIPAGSTSATITGTLLENNPFAAPNKTLTVTLGTPLRLAQDPPTEAKLGATPSITLTIVNTTAPPLVQFSDASESVNESAGTFSVTVTLSAGSDTTTTIPFALGGTAVSGTDYNGVTASPLVIPAGSTSATITGTLLENNPFSAPNKTLTLMLGTPTNATLGDTLSNTVTIVNTTPAPTAQFNLASESVSVNADTFSISVTLSTASDTTMTIPFTLGGTAVPVTDYSNVTASPLVIAPGQTTAAITGTILNEGLFAGPIDDMLTVTLGVSTNAALGTPSTNTLTINKITTPLSFSGLTAQETYIQALYVNDLGRTGSKVELDFWVAVMNGPGGTAAAVAGIENSPEGTDHLVKSWYLLYLGRSAENGEELGWAGLLQHGQSEETVLSLILSSPEFMQRSQTLVSGGSADENFVQNLYQQLLHRTGSANEVASWVNALPELGQQGVALGFLQSLEFRSNLFAEYYQGLLSRTGRPDEVNYWVSTGLDAFSVLEGFETSPEFLSKA